jgi:hypothetical protein
MEKEKKRVGPGWRKRNEEGVGQGKNWPRRLRE